MATVARTGLLLAILEHRLLPVREIEAELDLSEAEESSASLADILQG